MKVCIDSGHGGKDSGAVGQKGLRECDVVLAIAKMLVELLKEAGETTMLTRAGDIFLELKERCTLANIWKADLFVSVHLNSNGPNAVGVETLYVSEKGRSFAMPIQKALTAATGERDRGVKLRTDLYVLNGTHMPAVLVEAGFISNPETEARLKDTNYQLMIANAICLGIAGESKGVGALA